MSLTIENLSAGYGKTSVLQDINATAKPGELIGLVGPNGSGKSCLLKTIAGLIMPTAGQVSLGGRPALSLSSKVRAKQIAWLAQDRSAAWALSVRALVALGRAPYRGRLGKLSADDEAAIDTAMAAAHCTDLQDRRFDALSGGEQARVLLARALAVGAPFLLADEPTASLDPYYQISIMQSLRGEAKNNKTKGGKTVITSLHDLPLAKQYCDRIWVMQGGKFVADNVPDIALSDTILADVFRIKNQNGQMISVQKQSTFKN
ncbi:MAG: ABC transporter ATP-binding protein [Robiginitomaculum sp.]|nr:ABC transporter ATP-binding protein [Robiginitomaculum sp.]